MTEWRHLLEAPNGAEAPLRRFSVLRKQGYSFLYLPRQSKLADATLQLYPAQTLWARTLLLVASWLVRMGFRLNGEKKSIPVSAESPFGIFLKKLIPGSVDVPAFGVLGGNARTPGRRYTLLLFDEAGLPQVVVKVGLSERAKQLVQLEQDFFFPEAPHQPAVTTAIDFYRNTDANAIAYRYETGKPPTYDQQEGFDSILASWISNEDAVPLPELPMWEEIEKLLENDPGLGPVFETLGETRVRPVLFHGDFTSWNIRVSPGGQWRVLDWERSRARGVPGWDWFHYLTQHHTMVMHSRPEVTLSQLEALWTGPRFLRYARQAGIENVLKELTLLYFLYSLHYFSPSDNSRELRLLAEKFRQRHFEQLPMRGSSLKISVVTPSYKQLPWLKLCIASVADQQGVAVEHIIQDAQSGPELEAWVQQHSKAKLFVEADSGMYDAINRGFARATGDIVCWLNSDEQYLEGSLAKVARFFEMNPDVDVLFGDALLIGNAGTLLSYRKIVFPNRIHIQLAHLNVLSCATFVRRSLLERGHYLNSRWKAIADAVWIVELLKAKIPMALLNEPLAVFTITDTNLGQTSLAFTESVHWQRETLGGKVRLRPLFIIWHRLNKLAFGAYWPRSVSTRIYSLSDPEHRKKQSASFLGFKWPRAV